MDERPFRSRPTSRPARASERPAAPEPSKPEKVSAPEPKKPAPESTRTKPTGGKSAKKSAGKLGWWIGGIIVAAVVVLLAWTLLGMRTSSSNSLIDSSKYQAVFSTNGQVYFGKLKDTNSDYMKLTTAYYLQSQAATATEDDVVQNDSKLIKLGNEIYGPEDTIMFSKQQILYFENLKPDSKVSKLIDQYEASH